jgi:hypothetical protein
LFNLFKNLLYRRRWARKLYMPIATIRSIWTETKLIHIALPGIIIGVLVDAVGLAALSKPSKKPTDGHPNLVILMKIPAIIPLHTQTPQPVPAYRLPEILLGNLLPGI